MRERIMYKYIFLIFLSVFSIQAVESTEISLPKFTLPQLEDTQSYLNENDILGHVVVLNVWESLCIPCIAEHPLLLQLAHKGISIYRIDLQDNFLKAIRFLETSGNPFQASIVQHGYFK